MDVNIILCEKLRRNAVLLSQGTDVADRSARRLLHHIAELSGQEEFPFSRHRIDFDLQRVAAYTRPCQTAYDPDVILGVLFLVCVTFPPKIFFQILLCDTDTLCIIFEKFPRGFPADLANLAFKLADSRFLCYNR